jgi:hypothetical protein
MKKMEGGGGRQRKTVPRLTMGRLFTDIAEVLNMMVGGIVAHQSAIKIRRVAEHSTVQALNNQSERDAFGKLLC